MRTYFYYTALAILGIAFAFNSCSYDYSTIKKGDGKYERAFKKYAKTDFDNPYNFFMITEIEVSDSINPKTMIDLANELRKVIRITGKRSYKDKLDELTKELENEVGIIPFCVKVRQKIGEEIKLVMYYGMENLKDGKITIRTETIKLNDKAMPKCYVELVDLADELLN